MSTSLLSPTDLTLKTKEVIGRDEEIERLKKYLYARGDNNFVYYYADGGFGKTRLVEELQKLVDKANKEAKGGFYSSGIIDLYHTDTHSTSDVERTIVEGLDPGKKYFPEYRQKREQFEKLRERGAYPKVVEEARKQLSQIFIDDFRDMAHDARKLVICFDTVELLQYESSVVEEKAGLDTIDTRLKPWLLKNLKQLRNVLVIFAGRPKKQTLGETIDLHQRFIDSLTTTFGKNLDIIELAPFSLEETDLLVIELGDGDHLVPDDYLPIVHRLTKGRPIFIHLLVDLIKFLSLEPNEVFKMFDDYQDLIDVPEEDDALAEAVRSIEDKIFSALFYETGDKGEYLLNIAFMPKGVTPSILNVAMGMPEDQAEELLIDLERLSFTKKYSAPKGSEKLHGNRIFLHDEMYRLLTSSKKLTNLFIRERQIANTLVNDYYAPRLRNLENEIDALYADSEARIQLRERQQKLQVEQLYYKLVQDPRIGYKEYKKLSDKASRNRWVGFSMRLLDEFLRFYNDPSRRKLFEKYGLTYEKITRESTLLWVERFRWWARYQEVDKFARYVLDHPKQFFIDPDKHNGILGSIWGIWAYVQRVLHGYVQKVVFEAQQMLQQLPELKDCTPEQALARARLAYAIAYHLNRGGMLNRSAEHYVEGKAAFRKLIPDYPEYEEELAILLNALAFVYAKQGRMVLARTLAHESLRIHEGLGIKYSTGLTLSVLSQIARMRGNHFRAVEYGEEALALFRAIADPHGTILAQLAIDQAQRRNAKNEIEQGRKLAIAKETLENSSQSLGAMIELAEDKKLEGDLLDLLAELGRVYRELGRVTVDLDGMEASIPIFNESIKLLNQVTNNESWDKGVRANALQDLADAYFFAGDPISAKRQLGKVEALIGEEYLIEESKTVSEDLSREYFSPLGKVELLRGQILFNSGEPLDGLKHYVYAHIYFSRFSPDAAEADAMIEFLYRHLRDLSADMKQEILESIKTWVMQKGWEEDVTGFIVTVEDLLGT